MTFSNGDRTRSGNTLPMVRRAGVWLALPRFVFILSAVSNGPTLLAQTDRILEKVAENRRIVLRGNIHPKAQRQYDQGPVAPSMKLSYITLTLKKSDAQQVALEQLLRQQQDPSSPVFRKWLMPE
jgi:hypothetical protein